MHGILGWKNMEINLKLLKIQNPWWEGKSLKFDPIIDEYDKNKIKRQYDFKNTLPGHIEVLLGPRGTGKTTALKLLIRHLIDIKGVTPERVFYFSCHNLHSYEQLNEIIKTYINWARKESKITKQLFILIDEISCLSKWEEGIYFLRQARVLQNIFLVLTGSFFPGGDSSKKFFSARGVKKTIFTNLSFRETIKALQSTNKELLPFKDSYDKLQYKKLEYFLDIYFLTGGFLPAINSFKQRGAVAQTVYDRYLDWLFMDVAGQGRDLTLFKQISRQIFSFLGGVSGYQTIAGKTKAKNHRTIAEYLLMLERQFVLKVLYQINEEGQRIIRGGKKIYWQNSFLFWVFYSSQWGAFDSWHFSRESLHEEEVLGKFIDNLIFCHILGLMARKTQGDIGFYHNGRTGEDITFVIHHAGRLLPILARYDNKITKKDYIMIEKKIFHSLLLLVVIFLKKKENCEYGH